MTVNRITAVGVMACYLLLFSFSASAARPSHRVHYTLANTSKPKLPRRIIVLPVNIEVKEKTFGGVSEVVDAWSAKASRNIFRALAKYTKNNKRMRLIRTPDFSSSENSRISEHLGLYRKVVNTATYVTTEPQAWKHKLKKFDYTIGSGLNFLRAKTSADTALLVYGEDEVSSSGRKTAAVVGNIPLLGGLVGGPPQLGHSFIHVGMVDLRTGALLWVNSAFKTGSSDLRRAKDAQKMIDAIFKDYPGIEKYRKAYVK